MKFGSKMGSMMHHKEKSKGKIEETKEELLPEKREKATAIVPASKEEATGLTQKKEDVVAKTTEEEGGKVNGKVVIESFKAAYKEQEISPKWMAFTAVGLASLAISALQLVWLVLKLSYKFIISTPWILKSIFWLGLSLVALAFGISRHVILPIVLVLGNLWIFRVTIIKLVVRIVKEKKGIILRELTLEGRAGLKPTRAVAVELGNFGIKAREDEPEELLEFNQLGVNVSQPDPKKLKFNLDILLDGLEVNLVTYDMQFKDTNLTRFLASLGGEDQDNDAEAAPAPAPAEEPKPKKEDEEKKEGRFNISITLTHVKIIAKHSSKQFGLRSLGAPMTIEKETVDAEILGSKTKLFFWLNRFIVRQVVSGGFNIATSAVDGVGALATGAVGAVLGGVDSVADHVPGGSIVKGATGGTRKIVGGAFSGASKMTHGVAGGGKAIVGGLTSGSVQGMKDGFSKAGSEVGGGVVGGLSDVGGGVYSAGGDVGGGFTKAAGMGGSKEESNEEKTPAAKRKSKSYNPFKKSKSPAH